MNIRDTKNLISREIILIIIINPLTLLLERTIKFYGLDLVLLLYYLLTTIILFFTMWFLFNRFILLRFYSDVLGLTFCIITLLLWFIQKEALPLYIFGIAIIILLFLPTVDNFKEKEKIVKGNNFKAITYFFIIAFIGISLSFLSAALFWLNLYLYAIVSIEIFNLITLIFKKIRAKSKNKEIKHTSAKNIKFKIYIKNLFITLIAGLFPFLLAGLLFILFYGYFIFIPVEFTSAKILLGIFFAIFSAILSLTLIKI
ncbi:MAG: hypothetical protein ACTSPW_20605 [Promethearchaeota archaeon]